MPKESRTLALKPGISVIPMSTFVVMIDRIFLVQQSREDVFPGRNDGGHGAISPVVAMALPPTLFEKFLPTPAKGCQISGPAWAPELAVTDHDGHRASCEHTRTVPNDVTKTVQSRCVETPANSFNCAPSVLDDFRPLVSGTSNEH